MLQRRSDREENFGVLCAFAIFDLLATSHYLFSGSQPGHVPGRFVLSGRCVTAVPSNGDR